MISWTTLKSTNKDCLFFNLFMFSCSHGFFSHFFLPSWWFTLRDQHILALRHHSPLYHEHFPQPLLGNPPLHQENFLHPSQEWHNYCKHPHFRHHNFPLPSQEKPLGDCKSQSTRPIPWDPENGGKPPRPRQNPPRPRAIPLPRNPRGNPAPPRGEKGPKPWPCISEKSSIPPWPDMGPNDAGKGHLGGKPPNARGPNPQPRFAPGNGTVVQKFGRCWESKLPRGENPPLGHEKCGVSKPLPREANPPLEQEGWLNGLVGGARSSCDRLGSHFGQETISPHSKHLKQAVSNLSLQFSQCNGFSLLKTTTIVTNLIVKYLYTLPQPSSTLDVFQLLWNYTMKLLKTTRLFYPPALAQYWFLNIAWLHQHFENRDYFI